VHDRITLFENDSIVPKNKKNSTGKEESMSRDQRKKRL